MATNLSNFTDVLGDVDEIEDSQVSQPLSFPSSTECSLQNIKEPIQNKKYLRPPKGTGQYRELRSLEEIDPKYKDVFTYPFFNIIQSRVIEDALYSDKSMVVCAPTGSGKTVVFEMAIVQLLMEIEDKCSDEDYKIIYMAPVKALCTERLTEWYSKFTRLGLLCVEVTGDTDVDFTQLQAYKVIITTPEKWDMLTRRWRDHRGLVEMIKLFLIDEVHILNDETRGPVLEAVVSRMKTIQASAQSAHRIEKLKKQYKNVSENGVIDLVKEDEDPPPRIRFVAVSATVSNPEDVAAWLGTGDKPAVYYKFGDECRPVRLRRVVEGYPCSEGTSIFKFDIILSYKLWPIIQKYHDGKPTLIFCNTRKSVAMTAETLSREITISFNPEQLAKLTALAATLRNKKLQSLIMAGVGCHHAGLLYEERTNIEQAFRKGDLPILITTTTLAMGVNLPAHLVIIKNTQQYVNGGYQEYSISTVLQMVGRAGRPQFDTEATAVIMTRQKDKARYQALAGGSEPLQSYLHKRLAENLNSETALGTVGDVAQCVEWLRSTFLYIRAAKDPKRYLGLAAAAPEHLKLKKLEELCVIAMNGLASAGLITMDEASCIASTEAGQLMSLYYLDLETMKHIMKIQGNETLERLLLIIAESHELSDMHLRTDERRTLNALNRSNSTATIRFPMKGKITTKQMKLSCIIQAVLGCLPITDPSLNQEAMKIMRIAVRICKCLVAYVTRPESISQQLKYYSAILNSIILAKCITAHLWENSPYVSKQLKGIGPTFSTLLATAGKVNFMLLEESHPRDLERIMNKGAPAGNILRKQISLLPKYQITTTPVDETTVSVKLLLINHSFLSENIEQLTADVTHKSYVVVGDSENHILMLRSFTDKELISFYDGCIDYKITRKHNFEHKIFVHCISSTFVGLDAKCEYTFTNMINAPTLSSSHEMSHHFTTTYNIKDSESNFSGCARERKRKIVNEDITQSKEKKKRDNALADKIKLLKESFGKTSNNLQKNIQIAQDVSQNMFKDNSSTGKSEIKEMDTNIDQVKNTLYRLDDDLDDIMDDSKIDSILNEIESEITKSNTTEQVMNCELNKSEFKTKREGLGNSNKLKRNYPLKGNLHHHNFSSKRRYNHKLRPPHNFTFLDLLEKNMDLSNDELPANETGFTETIKAHVENYIQSTHEAPIDRDIGLKQLCGDDGAVMLADTKDNYTHYEKQIPVIDTTYVDKMETSDINKVILITNLENHKSTDSDENSMKQNDYSTNYCKNVSPSNQTYEDNITNYDEYHYAISKSLENDTNNISWQKPNSDIEKQDKGKQAIPNMIDNNQIISEHEVADPMENDVIDVSKEGSKFETINQELPENKTVPNDIADIVNQDLPLIELNKISICDGNYKPRSLTSNKYNIPKPLESSPAPIKDTLALGFQYRKDPSALYRNISVHQTLDIPFNSINGTLFEQSLMPQIENLRTENPGSFYSQIQNKANLVIKNENPSVVNTISEIVASDDKINNENHIISSNPSQKVYFDKIDQEWTDNSDMNNNDYEEIFSYSAEKVDIHTKLTSEHKIRVIKRLKVDLDIRKMVTKVNETDDSAVTIKANYHDSKNCKKQNKTSLEMFDLDQQLINKNNEKSDEKCTKIILSQRASNENGRTANNSSVLPTSMNGKDSNYRGDNNDQVTNPENKELANILQKYSKLFGNTEKSTNSLSCNVQTAKGTKVHLKPKTVPSRPFKISDIHHLSVPLPSILVDDVKTTTNSNEPTYSQRVGPTNTDNTNSVPGNMINTEIKPFKHVNEEFLKNTQDYLDFVTPNQSPVEQMEHALDVSETDFKIDQSMFNPKTLLQSMRDQDDVEIIPPPAEFGNDTICSYSPAVENCNTNVVVMDYEPTLASVFDDRILDQSVFENNYQSDVGLTPSKEIETWTLTHDEDDEYAHPESQTSSKSYTIMHRNPMFQNNEQDHLQSYNLGNRHGRLSAFKFNRKCKLKL